MPLGFRGGHHRPGNRGGRSHMGVAACGGKAGEVPEMAFDRDQSKASGMARYIRQALTWRHLRPGPGDFLEEHYIHLRVVRGRFHGGMAEDRANRWERDPLAEHMRGRGLA